MMDEAEEAAEVVIEAVLPGARMRFRSAEEQSGEETHDFDLSLPDGRRGAVEATQARDQDLSRVEAKLTRREWYMPTERCQRRWLLFLTERSDVERIEASADVHLAKLEANGWTEFNEHDARTSETVRILVEELGADGGTSSDTDPPGLHFSLGSYMGSQVTPGHILRVVTDAAQKKQEKLNRATAEECHLFVLIHHHEGRGAWGSMLKTDPPNENPELPASIDHVWVAMAAPEGEGYLVWRGGQEMAWTNLGVVTAG